MGFGGFGMPSMPEMPDVKMPDMPEMKVPDMPEMKVPDMPGQSSTPQEATPEESTELEESMPEELAALEQDLGSSGGGPFAFSSGLPDCCTSNPEYYKVVAEMPNARLIEMTMPPGAEDKPHEHPAHSMYVVQGGKVAISGPPDAEAHEMDIPTGAPPIMPAGPHKVKNAGDTELKIIFVEALPQCKPCGDIADFVSPFSVAPECYSLLAEDDNWVTGLLTMEPGATDQLHHHRDHLIYVLEGEEVTIYPEGNLEDGHAVPIKPNAGIPAPMSAGAIFGNHIMKNTGTSSVKMVFFEMKL